MIARIQNKLLTPIMGVVLFLLSSCAKNKGTPEYGGYPESIGKIVTTQCAISGCHNSVSADACAGLDLSSWETLFRGSTNNSAIIPYRPDQSFFLYAVNTFSDLGPKLYPPMPINKTALSKNDVIAIKSWIHQGAPNNRGETKFSDYSKRKIFVANQGCDFITVFDGEAKLAARAFNVGNTQGTEAPHDMMISPDRKYIYVSFYASNLFQKYRTSDYRKVGELTLPVSGWHTLDISDDSRLAATTHLDGDGKVALIDLDNMKIIAIYQGSGLFIYPHGCAFNHIGNQVYITAQQGNFIYKVNISDSQNPDINRIVLQPGTVANPNGIYKPYDIDYFPDYSKYAVTCQGTNELRIFDAYTDSLLSVINTSGVPQLISFSKKRPYLFVSCMADTSNAQAKSSVDVINYKTLKKIAGIFTGYEPRGITVDDAGQCVWVANRNTSAGGWSPHHTTSCAGRDGYMTIIDMNTLQLIPQWEAEVSVDPYCVVIKE